VPLVDLRRRGHHLDHDHGKREAQRGGDPAAIRGYRADEDHGRRDQQQQVSEQVIDRKLDDAEDKNDRKDFGQSGAHRTAGG
jgi:hypothetical protein